MRAIPLFALALLMGAAACSGGTPLPSPGAASNVRHTRTVLARLVVKVPRKKHRLHRARYVSPATASLAYSIDGMTQTPIVVATSNPNCTVVGQTYLRCSANFALAPGQHTFSFTADDSNGVALSANTDTSLDVKAGAANIIAVTLGGIAQSLLVRPASAFGVTGSQATGFTISGNAPQRFDVIPLDADNDLIVGPGAPQPIVAASPASMSVSPAASSAPNTIALTSNYEATNDPTVTKASSLTITATPVPDSGGTTVSTTIPLTLQQPWIYVADQNGGKVLAFDEEGNAKTLAHPIGGLVNPSGLVYDYGNNLLYVADNVTNAVTAYRADGTPYTLSGASPFAGLNGPAGLAYDPASNSIYVVTFAYGSGTVAAFDEQGNAQTLSGFFAGVNAAYTLTYNSNEDWFYVASCTGATIPPTTSTSPGTINAYSSQGALISIGGTFPYLDNPIGMAYDPHNGLLYVANDDFNALQGTLTAYDEQGNHQTLAGNPSAVDLSWGLTYDAHNGRIYMAVDRSATPPVRAYDERGFSITTAGSFTGLSSPTELTVAP